jgi:von Willebrand factor type A domain
VKRWMASLVVLGTILGVVGPAAAADSTLPGGTSISVDVTAPADGATLAAGSPVTITGTASVEAGVAVPNTSLVFVLDVSGSTASSSGINCDSVGGADSILACEKAAVQQLVAEAGLASSPILDVGVATFPPGSVLALTPPSNTAAIAAYLAPLAAGGGTNFSTGLAGAATVLGPSTAGERTVVLLTDGDGDRTGGEPPLNAVVKAFAIAGAGCDDPDLLGVIGTVGLPGSGCQVIDDLSELAGVIGTAIGSNLASVTVTVDGSPVPAVVTPTPPVAGPASVSFTASLPAGLAAGPHQICATAAGSDGGGSGSAQDCVSVSVSGASVDCAGPTICTLVLEDPGVSQATFFAPPAFDKTVNMFVNAGAPGECGGSNCFTGYDVVFDDTGHNGYAELTVVTDGPVSARQFARAAVFIDGQQVRRDCGGPVVRAVIDALAKHLSYTRKLPCKHIRWLRNRHVEYFVRFAADPGFRMR